MKKMLISLLSKWLTKLLYKQDVNHDTLDTPQKTLDFLTQQNIKFQKSAFNDGNISPIIMNQTVENGQSPYAVVLTCSDSRVVPEHIFMAGIGELFTIINAGNVVDNVVLGSVEYGIEHLGAKVVIVLGHTHCGAVSAAINHAGHGNIATITESICSCLHNEEDPANAEILNVENSLKEIAKSEIVSKLIEEEKVILIGAIYNTETGEIDFMDEKQYV
ncbi:MAG: carbonic anhydrase [Clostridia bacterium]